MCFIYLCGGKVTLYLVWISIAGHHLIRIYKDELNKSFSFFWNFFEMISNIDNMYYWQSHKITRSEFQYRMYTHWFISILVCENYCSFAKKLFSPGPSFFCVLLWLKSLKTKKSWQVSFKTPPMSLKFTNLNTNMKVSNTFCCWLSGVILF